MNVVYSHIMSRVTLLDVFVRQKLTMSQARKALHVPYNCLDQQVKKYLKPEEIKQIKPERVRYTKKHKRIYVKIALLSSFGAVHEEYNINEKLLKRWAKDQGLEEQTKLKVAADKAKAKAAKLKTVQGI